MPAVPVNAAIQLLGGPPSSAGSRQMYQSRLGLSVDDRLSRNHGCWTDVWFGTQSSRTRIPRSWSSAHQVVEVGQGPEQRVDVAVVAHVVAEVGHRRAEDRREPDGVDAQPGQVVEVAGEASQITDAVAARVGERPRIDLVHDRRLPPRIAIAA